MREMGKRWSKLQQRLYNLMDSNINFQIHCSLYEMNSNNGYHSNKLPRYFITINIADDKENTVESKNKNGDKVNSRNEIIFDYPRMFDTTIRYGFNSYPWDPDISEISNLIEEYIEKPKSELLHPFNNNNCQATNNLLEILRVCDRRIGKRQLRKIKDTTDKEILHRIIDKRLSKGDKT